jgi:hypothetical protein
MSGWLSLSLWIAFTSLYILDAAMTRTALRKGCHEQIRFTRTLIEELGLDKAMLVKSLLPLPFLIPIILFWNYPILNLILDIIFAVLIIRCSYVVLHDWREFAAARSSDYLLING